MNLDLITLNEVLNGGTNVYFYQEKMAGAWVAYGYSAFLLSQIDGVKHLSSFSDKIQMPCTCITTADFKGIVKDNMSTIECKDGFYLLPVKEKVDANAYQNWVAGLK